MKDKLKIAIYSEDIPDATFIEQCIKNLSQNNCEIYLFGFVNKTMSYSKSVSVFAYKNTKVNKIFHLLKYTLLLFFFKPSKKIKLDDILKKQSKNLLSDKIKYYPVLWCQPDVFHVQFTKGLADWVWVKDFDIKLVLSLYESPINYFSNIDEALVRMYKENFSKVDAFHAVSKAIAKEAEHYGVLKEKIKVIYEGIPLNSEKVIKPKENTIFQIISVGKSHWKKGYNYALDACVLLKKQDIQFHYTIIGGAEGIELAYQVCDLELENEVTLLNVLPYAEEQEFMVCADLLLLSSVEEGIDKVVLKAMLNNTLVLTSASDGMQEVIEDGGNGFMVPVRDSEAIAEKVIKIKGLQSDKCTKVLEKANYSIRTKYSKHQMVEQMLALYQQL